MSNESQVVCVSSFLNTNKQAIFGLSNSQNLRESELVKQFMALPVVGFQKMRFAGLFGWKQFRTDYLLTIGGRSFLTEFKKVKEGCEYGFWHSIIQGQLYRHLCPSSEEYPIICFVFDWGRNSGQYFSPQESGFFDKFKSDKIFMVRISLRESPFIEHNLNNEWERIE